MDNAVSEYRSAKSRLEDISTELTMQTQQMDALLAKDSLTYIEKEQLEQLKEATKELQAQEDIEAGRAERASKEAANKTVDAYHTQYGKHKTSESSINESIAIDNYLPSETADKNNIPSNITAYLKNKGLATQAQEELNKAASNSSSKAAIESDLQFYIDETDAYWRTIFLTSKRNDSPSRKSIRTPRRSRRQTPTR